MTYHDRNIIKIISVGYLCLCIKMKNYLQAKKGSSSGHIPSWRRKTIKLKWLLLFLVGHSSSSYEGSWYIEYSVHCMRYSHKSNLSNLTCFEILPESLSKYSMPCLVHVADLGGVWYVQVKAPGVPLKNEQFCNYSTRMQCNGETKISIMTNW